MIRTGGFTLGKTGGGVKGTGRERSRTRAEGLFDLTGLGGDFDSLLIASVFAEVMSQGPRGEVNISEFQMENEYI